MRILLCAIFLFLSMAANADSASDFLFEVGYTGSSVHPSALNTARQDFYWNDTTPGSGSFSDLSGFNVSLGYKFFDDVFLLLQFSQLQQTLGATTVGSSYTVTEFFEYQPIYLLADVPFELDSDWTISLRGGVGYAYRDELRQQISGGEIVTWGAHPIPLQIGATVCWNALSTVGIYLGARYEYVKSDLKATQNFQTTFNGSAITSGQTYSNVATGAAAIADMSGLYYELGLRFNF